MSKIKKIEFKNHEILGNLTLNFQKSNERIADNIVIAGENGSGKTTILNNIYNLCNKYFTISVEILKKDFVIAIELDVTGEGYYYGEKDVKRLKLMYNPNNSGRNIFTLEVLDVVNGIFIPSLFKYNDNVCKEYVFKCLYSKVDINYKLKSEVFSVTNESIDNNEIEIPYDISNNTIQLLVNINSQDNNDLSKWVDKNPGSSPPESVKHIRMNRFTKAFDYMFHKKISFFGIKDNIVPIFKNHDKEVNINDLSSGEKQIVYRGVQLLKNKNSIGSVPVLIDEPEISMHPIWEKIFMVITKIYL